MGSRTYHDPLHHGISLDADQPAEAMVLALVDSAPFQIEPPFYPRPTVTVIPSVPPLAMTYLSLPSFSKLYN